jgi:uncharacterized protein GlcG (DUF336 family)
MRHLMKSITYEQATTIVAAALAFARERKFKPLGVAVLDVRGALTAYGAEDGSSLGRAHVAIGKASGVIEMGLGARALVKRAQDAPVFVGALNGVFPRGAIPLVRWASPAIRPTTTKRQLWPASRPQV